MVGGEGTPVPSEDILDLLSELVNKSLVVAESGSGGAERYRMLETLRQYGQERLIAAGESEAVHRRHSRYYLDFAEQAGLHLQRPEQLMYLARLDLERDNLRAAIQWFVSNGEAEEGFRFAGALILFWMYRGLMPELRDWTTRLLDLPGVVSASTTRVKTMAWVGAWASMQGDMAACRRLMTESLAMAQQLADDRSLAWALLLASGHGGANREQWYHATDWQLAEAAVFHFRAAGDRWGIAWSLCRLGHLAFLQGDVERAKVLLTECLATARAAGDRHSVGIALEFLGVATITESDVEAAASLNEGLRLYRELGDQEGIASVENLLGRLDSLNGRYEAGNEHYRASLRLTRDMLWMNRITSSLDGLATVAAGLGQPERALRLASASARLREDAAVEPIPIEQVELERALMSVREALGQAASATAWTQGQALALEMAIDYAMKDDDA